MDVITAARALTGDTLAFHLLLVTFGVGLPVFISLFELLYLIKKKDVYLRLAKSWTRALVILFIAGAVSGMIVSLSFNIIWPTFISFASNSFIFAGTSSTINICAVINFYNTSSSPRNFLIVFRKGKIEIGFEI